VVAAQTWPKQAPGALSCLELSVYLSALAHLELQKSGFAARQRRVVERGEHQVPDARLHEQLLAHGVHVAGGAAVTHAHVRSARPPALDTNRIHLVLFGMHHRIHLVLFDVVKGVVGGERERPRHYSLSVCLSVCYPSYGYTKLPYST
jgi:hypothetical protein